MLGAIHLSARRSSVAVHPRRVPDSNDDAFRGLDARHRLGPWLGSRVVQRCIPFRGELGCGRATLSMSATSKDRGRRSAQAEFDAALRHGLMPASWRTALRRSCTAPIGFPISRCSIASGRAIRAEWGATVDTNSGKHSQTIAAQFPAQPRPLVTDSQQSLAVFDRVR